MTDDWYYAQNNERKGPVPFAKLKAMAAAGWLAPEDLVWRSGMASWVPASEADGLYVNTLGRVLQKTIAGVRSPPERAAAGSPRDATPPSIPVKITKPSRRKPVVTAPEIESEELAIRHMIAAGGGFLAALGIAFTVITQSNMALALTVSGLCLAAAGLYVEIGRLSGEAIANIGKAAKESAERRLRAKEIALEKQRLDLEASRIAQEQAAREAPMPPAVPAAVLATQQAEHISQLPGGSGQVLVINHPPVRLWSPGLAALLSFFLPGLGQLYKGQIINGVVWFFMVMFGYAALILPGLVLHFFCVLGALSGNPWSEGKTTVVRQ